MINQFRTLNPLNLILLFAYTFFMRMAIFADLPEVLRFEFLESYAKFLITIPENSFSPASNVFFAGIIIYVPKEIIGSASASSPIVIAMMQTITDNAITTVNTIAINRCLNQLLVSMIKDDLLNAIIKLCTPLVEKNKANRKPKDNRPEFCCKTISSSVLLKAL